MLLAAVDRLQEGKEETHQTQTVDTMLRDQVTTDRNVEQVNQIIQQQQLPEVVPNNAFYPPANDEEKRATPSNHEGSAQEIQRVVVPGD